MLTNYQLQKMRAWMIHFYTSLGLICAFAVLVNIVDGNAQSAFLWMGLANFIDTTDGTMARKWRVTVWAPEFDGRKLDDIVDYINYAFLPFFLAFRFELIAADALGLFTMGVVLLAAVYGFCQASAKTDDGFFTGFPNYWNFLILYLYLFNLPPQVNAAILLVFAALVFVPIKYMSYKTRGWMRTNWIISGLYGAMLLAILILLNDPPAWLVWGSLVFPVFYFIVSITLFVRGKRAIAANTGQTTG
jgi:phosphatidylcholine synthase